MALRFEQRQWNELARRDPLWAILTDPSKKDGRWPVEEFFATGRDQIAGVMQTAARLGFPKTRAAALDFGCGVGRLTQALTDYFDHVAGIDISPAMLDLARKYNRSGERCTYVLNTDAGFHNIGSDSLDLVYSMMVLQHVNPRHVRRYIREFVRVLRGGGLGIFQLPSRFAPRSVKARLANSLNMFCRGKILRDPEVFPMHGVPRNVVENDLRRAGAQILEVTADHSAGPEWKSYLYAFTK